MTKNRTAYQKKWWAKNKKRINTELRTSLEYRYNSLKSRCKREKRKFNITFKTYKKKLNAGCFYCKADLSKEVGGGVDRINNLNRNYIARNLVACCASCNKIKSNQLTVGEMKAAMTAVLRYRKRK